MFDEEPINEHGECCAEIHRLEQSEELAWGLIANSYGGDWEAAPPEWKIAATKWRDNYHDNTEKEITLPTDAG